MRRILVLAFLTVAACVPAGRPPASPPPKPAPVAAPAPIPAPALGPDWRDWPLTPGTWRYAGGTASFGAPGAEPRLTLRCDAGQRRIHLSVAGADTAQATVRTTSATRLLALRPAPGAQPSAAAALPATDPLLDALAFSRGRFTVERPGRPPLVVPAHAEVGRVVEDCRS